MIRRLFASIGKRIQRGLDFIANIRFHLDRGHAWSEAVERARRTLP